MPDSISCGCPPPPQTHTPSRENRLYCGEMEVVVLEYYELLYACFKLYKVGGCLTARRWHFAVCPASAMRDTECRHPLPLLSGERHPTYGKVEVCGA